MHTDDNRNIPLRVALSGADCFHLVLDRHATKHEAGGNVMRIVFFFDEPFPAARLQDVITRSDVMHWLCNIRLVTGRFWEIPYWEYTGGNRQCPVTVHEHAMEGELPAHILDRDITLEADHFVECDLVTYPSGREALVISWNHILLDGKGIGMLVQHLNDCWEQPAGGMPQHYFPEKEKSPGLYGYIRNMYRVKRFIRLSSKAPISSVTKPGVSSAGNFRNKLLYFDEAETAQISKNAFANGARFGENAFYLSCCAQVVNKLNQRNGKDGVMWLPIPYDGRRRGATGPVISNHVAYIFYRLPQEVLGQVPDTVKCLNEQMTRQIGEKRPQQYNTLLNMMRHIPLGLYYFLISRAGKGSFASFLYSATGDSFNRTDRFLGKAVSTLTIYPSSTYPPGLTFSCLKHRDKLNINIAYSSEIISNIELDTLVQGIRQLILQGK